MKRMITNIECLLSFCALVALQTAVVDMTMTTTKPVLVTDAMNTDDIHELKAHKKIDTLTQQQIAKILSPTGLSYADKYRRLELNLDDDRRPVPADDAFDQYQLWYVYSGQLVNTRGMPIGGPSTVNDTDYYQYRNRFTVPPPRLLMQSPSRDAIQFELFWQSLMTLSVVTGHSVAVKYYEVLYGEKLELNRYYKLDSMGILLSKKDGTKAYSLDLNVINTPSKKFYDPKKKTLKPMLIEKPSTIDYVIYATRANLREEV